VLYAKIYLKITIKGGLILSFLFSYISTFIVGVVSLVFGIIFQKIINTKYKLIYQTYVKVPGVIISRKVSTSMDSEGVVYPVVKYKTNEGEELIIQSRIGVGNLDYRVGDRMEVFYNPNNPTDAIINIPAARYLPIILGGVFSFVFLLISVISFITR